MLFNTWLWSAKGDIRTRITTRLLASRAYQLADSRFALTARVFPRLVTGRRNRLQKSSRSHFHSPFLERPERDGLLPLVRHTYGSDAWVGGLWALRERIQNFPSLVMWGVDDPAFPPRFLDRWKSALSAASIVLMPGVGPQRCPKGGEMSLPRPPSAKACRRCDRRTTTTHPEIPRRFIWRSGDTGQRTHQRDT